MHHAECGHVIAREDGREGDLFRQQGFHGLASGFLRGQIVDPHEIFLERRARIFQRQGIAVQQREARQMRGALDIGDLPVSLGQQVFHRDASGSQIVGADAIRSQVAGPAPHIDQVFPGSDEFTGTSRRSLDRGRHHNCPANVRIAGQRQKLTTFALE